MALFLGIVLIALNLRAPFTALAPVLTFIQQDFALSTAAVGALTSLPLLAFAVFSPLSATLAERFGLERTLFAALAVVAVGIALRSTGSIWLLFAGTAIIGMGIAQGNVLVPSLIKRDFSQNVAAVTGAYALAMGVGGALGSSVVFPLTQAFGWQIALAAFVALPAVALLIWALQLKARANIAPAQEARKQVGTIWRSALAWQVTMFMGLNAMIFYIAIGWLPTILIDQGLSATEAGSMHGVLQLATAIPGLLLAPFIKRMPDQRLAAAAGSLLSAASLLGLLLTPQLAFVWSALLGFSSGASMILGLTFIGLRTHTARDAAALSGMSQCVGYLMAAVGPIVLGALHDWQGGWSGALLATTCVAVLGAWSGMLAGRNSRVGS